ncbi:RNA 2',3'-cyclic phosphodiesterase [Candidatus Nanohalovita haloferacivicina]|uniref:RNA 2',3'-cyclic phosphodiesterase n=1 Tax=Candidatus Nanohalovita haloferacivicina TaxID=2978046 RepID=UPI00325FBDBD|nr:RNA 2',3'-cyclic 3'-phosphodiesterase [Candidatus Nanohalobia archaeon BNXNv]
MPRVFSAIEIEQTEALNKLKQVRNETDLGFKPVPTEKMHITLQFFKNTDKQEIKKIEQALNNVQQEPFNVEIRGLGAFPSKNHVRVIWAGINSEKIFDLHNQVSQHEVPDSSQHEFEPHITLHRVKKLRKGQKKTLHEKFEKYQGRKIADIKVDKVKLFESVLKENGPHYRKLKVKKLE